MVTANSIVQIKQIVLEKIILSDGTAYLRTDDGDWYFVHPDEIIHELDDEELENIYNLAKLGS